MVIEYMKIKSFGNAENIKFVPSDISPLTGEGELGIATVAAFEMFIFYGAKGTGFDVSAYLAAAKGPVAGGHILLSDGGRRYIVAREYFNSEERLLIRDADTEVEIKTRSNAGEFFFSRTAAEFIHGSGGAPIAVSDLIRPTPAGESTGRIEAAEILRLREQLELLGKKQMRLSAESMAARGINSAERLRRAREVQKELLDNDEKLKLAAGGKNGKTTLMSKRTAAIVLIVGGALLLAGLLIFFLMEHINMSKIVTFLVSLLALGLGTAVMLWIAVFKLVEALACRNMPDNEQVLRTRRDELTEKLDILLEGADFEELERAALRQDMTEVQRTNGEIQTELAEVEQEMKLTRERLNKMLDA